MKSKENLVFLGMMGSGKSSIGLIVSKKLKLKFYDIDLEIEKELKMKIFDIFKKKGEEYFRKVEEKITLKFLKKRKSVISLGGGAFMNKKIRDEILNNHCSFWLKLNNQNLILRIKNNPKRPLAYKATKQELENLINKRSFFYSKALYKINCDKLSKIEIVNNVINTYKND